MKKHEKTNMLDEVLRRAPADAYRYFKRRGMTHDQAEDAAQDVCVLILEDKTEFFKRYEETGDWISSYQRVLEEVLRNSKRPDALRRAAELTDDNAPIDRASPDSYVAAKELIAAANGFDLWPVMMGDGMVDEAEYFGVTRQRAHQKVEAKRKQLRNHLGLPKNV